MSFEVVDKSRDTSRTCDTRSEAEDTKSDMVGLGARPEDIEIRAENALQDGGRPQATDGTDDTDESTTATVADHALDRAETVPDEPPAIDRDPVNWMPDHFVDSIQGVPTVNRKGYCVIARQYNVSVTAEPVVRASETGFEYAEFEATATTESGETYSGFGSAHINRQDGDDAYLLNELAETRAMKRAVAWATGMGITAIEEMQGAL